MDSYIGISEKTELAIRTLVQNSTDEIIQLTNKGLIPIDEIEAKIIVSIRRPKEPDLDVTFEWKNDTFLAKEEVVEIPLYEKLSMFLEEHKLTGFSEPVKIPFEDPKTGEDTFDTFQARVLTEPFSIILTIELVSKVEGQERFARKRFRLSYKWRYVAEDIWWLDDYEIMVNEDAGKWKN